MNKKHPINTEMAEVLNSSNSPQQLEKTIQTEKKNPLAYNIHKSYALSESAYPDVIENIKSSMEYTYDGQVDLKRIVKIPITDELRRDILDGDPALYLSVSSITPTQKNQLPLAPTLGIGFLLGVGVVLILQFFQDKNKPH